MDKMMLTQNGYGGYNIPNNPILYNKPDDNVLDSVKFANGGSWFLSYSRYVVSRFYNQPLTGMVGNAYYGISDEMRMLWLYYYGLHEQSLYNYEISMSGNSAGAPFVPDQRPRTLLEHARGKLFDIIEPVKRSMSVQSLSYEVKMKKQSLRKDLEAKQMTEALLKDSGVSYMPGGVSEVGDEDIDDIVKKFRTKTEQDALKLARGVYYEEELERKFDYLALHQVVSNVSFLMFDINGNRICPMPVNGSQAIIDDRVTGDYSDDAEVGGYVIYMTPSEIFSRFPDLSDSQRTWIENMVRGEVNNTSIGDVLNYYNTCNNILFWDKNKGKVAVVYSYWLSTYTQNYFVSSDNNVVGIKNNEKYLTDESKFVKGKDKSGVDWKEKWHYCVMIGNSICADYGYVPYQYTPEGKGRPLPPFIYYINSMNEGIFRSMASRIKPISDQIEAASRKIKELMDKSAGRVYLLLGSKLGLTKDSAQEVFSDLRSMGFSIIEDSGQSGNPMDSQRAVSDELDFSLQPEVQEFIRWKVLLQQEQDAIMNMPPAVLGMQDNVIGKGVMAQTIAQSQKSFMSIMSGYERFISKAMRQIINIGKMINADYGQVQYYQVSDKELDAISFPKSAKYEDMGFYFESDDSIEEKDRQSLTTYLQAYMQNPTAAGAKAIRNTVSLMKFRSYNEGIEYLDKFIQEEEEKERLQAESNMKSEQQNNAAILQMQKQWEFFMTQYREDQQNYRKELDVIQKQGQQQIDNYNNSLSLLIKKQDAENKAAAQMESPQNEGEVTQ